MWNRASWLQVLYPSPVHSTTLFNLNELEDNSCRACLWPLWRGRVWVWIEELCGAQKLLFWGLPVASSVWGRTFCSPSLSQHLEQCLDVAGAQQTVFVCLINEVEFCCQLSKEYAMKVSVSFFPLVHCSRALSELMRSISWLLAGFCWTYLAQLSKDASSVYLLLDLKNQQFIFKIKVLGFKTSAEIFLYKYPLLVLLVFHIPTFKMWTLKMLLKRIGIDS